MDDMYNLSNYNVHIENFDNYTYAKNNPKSQLLSNDYYGWHA